MANESALIGWLSDTDEPCPVCGYCLRGVAEPRCPECNAGLELAVRSPDQPLAPWTTAVVFVSMAMGFDMVVGTLLTIPLVGSMFFTSGPIPTDLLVLFGSFWGAAAVLLMGLVGLLWKRRAFQRRSARLQWTIALAIGLVVFVGHAAAGAMMVFVF